MELVEKFAAIIAHCDRIPLAQFERDRIKGRLDYFRQQALCDLDRRQSPAMIAQQFAMILQSKKIENVLAPFRTRHDFWEEVAVFVGDHSYALVAPLGRKIVAKDFASVTGFFLLLLKEAQTMPESQRAIKLLVRFGLRVLVLESERPTAWRDHIEVEYVWRCIWPVLEKAGLLRRFQSDQDLKRLVQQFVARPR